MTDLTPIPPEQLGIEQPAPRTWVGKVFLPSQRLVAGQSEVMIELRQLLDGRLAIFAYSMLDKLVDCCGPAQPWVAVDSTQIHDMQSRAAADLVAWDLPLPNELQHAAEDR